MTRSDLTLAVVGLGAIGLPMAINLCRAEFRLRVHTRSRSAEADCRWAFFLRGNGRASDRALAQFYRRQGSGILGGRCIQPLVEEL